MAAIFYSAPVVVVGNGQLTREKPEPEKEACRRDAARRRMKRSTRVARELRTVATRKSEREHDYFARYTS